MRTAIPLYAVHLRNRLFAQLYPPMQFWVRRQAQQIVRSGWFGCWEEMQLNEAIRQKLSQTSVPAGATSAAATAILRFLMLSEAITYAEDEQMSSAIITSLLRNQQAVMGTVVNMLNAILNASMSLLNTMLS